MTAINFKKAFKILQLLPGADLKTVQDRYTSLVSASDFNLRWEQGDKEVQDIVDAYNDLQLLLEPYEKLSSLEQQRLLGALNELPENELKELLLLYPHNSVKFYWDSKTYEHLRNYLYLPKNTNLTSLIGGFFAIFNTCPVPSFAKENPYDNVGPSLWEKKHQ
ncbi:Uncharacterised protein [Legionella lansingensis]|uniref:Uncharacterized protein n=1 Tax=Legionella lansingensis TaxID=45067 RepID=A0A0W0VLP8_9GAMM|nr:hypothetical protein [Legionella lansingensis]KTD21000.1 hypothetical protein Llan_1730 [Legionella lansingensis]SNV44892.1 Uncharacterised protein [Legionella lansingensis]